MPSYSLAWPTMRELIQLRVGCIEARTLKASTRSCQKLPVVSRWKTGAFSEGGKVSNGCFEDEGVSAGWGFNITIGVAH